jgi:ferredoxin
LFWLAAIITGYVLKGFTKIDLTYGMSNISVEKKLILTFGAGIIIVPLALIFGKFASCKYVCWQAPFMMIGKRIRDRLGLYGLRIRADAASCKHCSACTIHCPMSIDVMEMAQQGEIVSDECILCGNCVDACKFNVLSYKISTLAKRKGEIGSQDLELGV